MDDGVVVVAVVGDAVVVDITGDVLDEIGSITRISLCSKLRQVFWEKIFGELKRLIQHHVHAFEKMPTSVTVEEPDTRVCRPDSCNNVSTRRHGDCVFIYSIPQVNIRDIFVIIPGCIIPLGVVTFTDTVIKSVTTFYIGCWKNTTTVYGCQTYFYHLEFMTMYVNWVYYTLGVCCFGIMENKNDFRSGL